MRLYIESCPWHGGFVSTKFCDEDNKSLRHPWGVLCHLLAPPVIHQCLLSNDSTDQCWVIFISANQSLRLNVCIRCTRVAYKQNISAPQSKRWRRRLHTDKTSCWDSLFVHWTVICWTDVINEMFVWIEVQIKSAGLYSIWRDMFATVVC